MTSTPPKLKNLLGEFAAICDRDTRAELLIEYAERFSPVPDAIARRPFPDNHKVPACESEAYAWVRSRPDRGSEIFFAVENPQGVSAKALATILSETLEGERAEDIAKIDEQLVLDIFGPAISMGKGQGLMGMVSMIKLLSLRISSGHSAA